MMSNFYKKFIVISVSVYMKLNIRSNKISKHFNNIFRVLIKYNVILNCTLLRYTIEHHFPRKPSKHCELITFLMIVLENILIRMKLSKHFF